MELELRHLRTVRAIAETGSLTKAAAALGLAQPALSTQLRRLERALGGPLFDRDRTGARLTPLGMVVLERARVVLPAVQNLQAEVVRLAGLGDGAQPAARPRRIRVGGTHGPVVGQLVGRIADTLPDVPVAVHTSWSVTEMTGLLLAGQLDYVLAGTCGEADPPAAGQLVWHTLAVEPVFVMLPEAHPLAASGEPVPLAALAGERWTSVPGDGCFSECFAAACHRAGFSPTALQEHDVSSGVHLVQVGRAAGLCRATFPPATGVATRPLAGDPLRWRHVLGWHPEAPAAAMAQAVAACARDGYADAVRRSSGYPHWSAAQLAFPPGRVPSASGDAAPPLPAGPRDSRDTSDSPGGAAPGVTA